MKPRRRFLEEAPIQIAIALLLIMLLGWPLILLPASRGMASLFAHIFAVWSLAVVLVYLVAACIRSGLDKDGNKQDVP